MSATQATVIAKIETLADTVFTIKHQRDTAQDALRDIIVGADMMLQMPADIAPKGWMLRYIQAVKSVAEAGLAS